MAVAETMLVKEHGHEAGPEAEVAGGLNAAGFGIELEGEAGGLIAPSHRSPYEPLKSSQLSNHKTEVMLNGRRCLGPPEAVGLRTFNRGGDSIIGGLNVTAGSVLQSCKQAVEHLFLG